MSIEFTFGDADKSLLEAERVRQAEKEIRIAQRKEKKRLYKIERRQERARILQLRKTLLEAKAEEKRKLAENRRIEKAEIKDSRSLLELEFERLEKQSDDNILHMYRDELIKVNNGEDIKNLVPSTVRKKFRENGILEGGAFYKSNTLSKKGLALINR